MTSLIESLIAGGVERKDDKRLEIIKRPIPTRARELWDMFGSMGVTASMPGLLRGMDLKKADPRNLTFGILGRWPSTAELAALPQPYNAQHHAAALVMSEEFRSTVLRRVFDAVPDRRRFLFVRMPRSAGDHAVKMLSDVFPFFPLNLQQEKYRRPQLFVPLMGEITARLGTARVISTAAPRLVYFTQAPRSELLGPDPLGWHYNVAAFRADDLLFTIVREPESLALSLVNNALTTLRTGARIPALSQVVDKFRPLPAADNLDGWRAIGRAILPLLALENPLCHALGEGTAASAIDTCKVVPITLVSLGGYASWARIALEAPPPPPSNISEPILRPEDLLAADRDALDVRIGEDRTFYAHFEKLHQDSGLPYVMGFDL